LKNLLQRKRGENGNMTHIKFEQIEIELRIRDLIEDLSIRKKNVQLKQTHAQKFDAWINQLEKILVQISNINSNVLPDIQQDLGNSFSFSNRNLVLTALVQPSVKKIFTEIKTHFRNDLEFVVKPKDLDLLESCSDTAKSLAWIGDTAIKYALLLKIWRPGITPEELHNKRQSIETNENLSILCDKWKLFDYRIHIDPDVPKKMTVSKTKGTLVEAIYGVIFIEQEIKGVQGAIDLIYL
jgi:dsRNA-specific ribonuclease